MKKDISVNTEAANEIADLITRAREAQKILESYNQEEIDRLTAAIGYEMCMNEELMERLAVLAFEETNLGDIPSKIAKVRGKGRQMWYDLKDQKTIGVVEEIPEKGLVRLVKPVGVIGSLVPSTQPEQHPLVQAMNSVKARDAIIFSPHPGAKRSTMETIEAIRDIISTYGGPVDAVIGIQEPTLDKTNELMRQCDLVIATGGQPMVRAAYSSGTPAYGVGAGNANIIVDSTAELKDAAEKIKASKTFDMSSGCSCDNSLIILEDVYDDMIKELEKVGAYLLDEEKKGLLQKAMWPEWPKNHVLNRAIVSKPVKTIAEVAGFQVPDGTSFMLVEETGSGEKYPFSGEKMSLTITIYKAKNIDEAISILNKNLAYSGSGHSCGIYTKTEENIEKVYMNTYTTRVVVNQPQALTNTGSWTSGMPYTSTLGCGTWGGNICSENVVLKHYLNNTWVIREIPNYQPTDEELFSGFEPIKK